jgi:L-rhamnose-H+ transport protein
MWMGGIAIYSSGTTLLGILGVSVGWALFQISLILCGNAAGLLTGEWRQMEARIQRVHIGGIVFLFLAIGMIAAANYSR